MGELIQNWKSLVYNLGIIIGAGFIGTVLHFILFRIFKHLNRLTSVLVYDSLIKHCRRPLGYIIPLLAINFAIPIVELPQNIFYIFDNVFRSLFIASVSWLIIRLTVVAEDIILSRYDIGDKDNLQARKLYTQIQTIRKILTVVIVTVAVALILMGFERFRQLGTGILASAGIASLIIGLAAQRIFANFLAGIQIAFTQPIRVDDVVIVENEWGRIEEITLTYVVVRIWDLRRLILPISYFIERPFQNWTRISADILGTVFIYTDYTVPVQEIREELHRILKNSEKWDGRVWVLQVTDATERTMELRALMSAPDASSAWDLRCEVREKLIEFIQKKYPDAMPKVRAEFHKLKDF
jgi:small-conductance mechanosensitive channel